MTIFTEVSPNTYLPIGDPDMPRTAKATTTDTLEHQAAADSDLEPLPTFDLPLPSDGLDATGESPLPDGVLLPQNGYLETRVKPSERCSTPSPRGGIGCTFRDEHPGRHSWQSAESAAESATADELAQLREQDEAEQPALPGTPEPVENDYTVPTEASFGKAKLMPAHGLRAIGDRLIADDDNLEHLRGVEMRYAWRRRGGTQGGNPRFARIKRPSVWEDHLTGGKVDFLVDVSADHVREGRFTERQIEAAIHEQLSRTERDDDDHDAFRINGPDFSGSISTLDRYGSWKPELRELRAHVEKLPLEQAIDDADAEEGEESE